MQPKASPRLLPERYAQSAANCVVVSGELRPLFAPVVASNPSKSGPYSTIFKADTAWFVWDKDVDVARGTIGTEQRYYYTGDGEPRMTTESLAKTGGGENYPAACRALGAPKPVTKPSISTSGSGGGSVSRYYCYTFYDDLDQESAPSPLSDMETHSSGGTWAISDMDAAPPNTGGISNITYVGTTVTVTSVEQPFNRAGEQITIAGVTTVTGVNGTWTLTGANAVSKTMTFEVTAAPTGAYNNATDTTDSWARVAPFGTCTKRLYRTSGSTSQFQLVAEGISGTTYNDTLSDGDIPGDELISGSWEMPPVGLEGIIALPNGSLAGFVGREVYFSEPYQPHAWPPEYAMRTDFTVVGIGAYASNVVVGTTGNPYMISGQEPGQMVSVKASVQHPCLSKRSVISLGDSVAYATTVGLVAVGDTGVNNISKDVFSEEGWAALDPYTMATEAANGGIYLLVTVRGFSRILFFDFADAGGVFDVSVAADDLYADPSTGRLYFSTYEGVDPVIMELPDDSGIYLPMEWRSREYTTPSPVNLGAARVIFDPRFTAVEIAALEAEYLAQVAANAAILAAGGIGGDINDYDVNAVEVNGDNLIDVTDPQYETPGVNFILFIDGEIKYTKFVDNTQAFRLPSGYLSDNYAVAVACRVPVRSIAIGETMLSLKNV